MQSTLRPASVVPRFERRELLGRGASGQVFLAWDSLTECAVALKQLDDLSAEGRSLLKREFRSLASLSHPCVAQLYELIEDDGGVVVTMELVDGPSLLDAACVKADRVILTLAGAGCDRMADFQLLSARRSSVVWFEADPFRAIVGVMQSMQSDDSMRILWSAQHPIDEPRDYVEQGLRWRASFELPEEGEFHRLPPAAAAG